MYKPLYLLLFCFITSGCQSVTNALRPAQQTDTAGQDLLPAAVNVHDFLRPEDALRCVPADKTYSYMGAVDEQTLILANENNDTIVATLRQACPRLVEEGRVMLLFRKGDQLSRIQNRMCMDDAFLMLWQNEISAGSSDSQRACIFRAFYKLPVTDVLEVVKTNKIQFSTFGVL